MSTDDITLDRMKQIFKQFARSQAYAARTLGVSEVSVSRFLNGHFKSKRLDRELPLVASELERTSGDCIGSVNTKTLRSQIAKIRKAAKRRNQK